MSSLQHQQGFIHRHEQLMACIAQVRTRVYRYIPAFCILARLGLRRPPVFVYQMAKVGSFSIMRSLQNQGRQAIHGHFLDTHNISCFVPRLVDERQRPFVEKICATHVRQATFLRAMLCGHRRLHVISLVRDPVARNISLFFQHFALYTGQHPSTWQNGTTALNALFLRLFRQGVPLFWFDVEMKAQFGIDVYARPFPHEQGYAHFQHQGTELLLLKLETPDAVRQQAIADFLNMPHFRLEHWNEAQNKQYASLYKSFTQSLRLPTWYLDSMYTSKHMQHFYLPDEIARFRARWEQTAARTR